MKTGLTKSLFPLYFCTTTLIFSIQAITQGYVTVYATEIFCAKCLSNV